MNGFITDRHQSNVDRLKELSSKGWSNMTAAEKIEWTGDPKTIEGANLLGRNNFRQQIVSIDHRLNTFTCTALSGGRYQYAGVNLGPASDFDGKTITLSIEAVAGTTGTTPLVSLFWHDEGGYYENTGVQLSRPGSITQALSKNAQNRKTLAAYVYVSTDPAVEAGAMVRYTGVMITVGSKKYPFVPYTEIVATPATKGAYNYSDLNRVELAATELSEMYSLGLLTKTDWKPEDVPTEADMNRYLANARKIRVICPNPSSLPVLPSSMKGFNYETANNIEKILAAAYEGAIGSYRSGELYSGEV